MKLHIWVPTEILLIEQAAKVKAEAEDGWFCVLPRHVDFVTSLVPGILSFELPGGRTEYVALDRGIMVKCGPDLSVSTRNATRGAELGKLRDTVEAHLRAHQDKEQAARAFEAKLESELVRQLLEVEQHA